MRAHLAIIITTTANYERWERNAFLLGVDAERFGYTDRRTAATPAAVETMRAVAESSGQDLDALAAEHGIDFEQATMADLNQLGREIAKGMNGVTSVSLSLP